ncbi:MAG: spiro-SPASM protein [Spirochaetes bacterium]|nr:spiro-SPASM protein [Spirochaetota bacterium]
MNIIALLYIDNDIKDSNLNFSGKYLPRELKERLQSGGIFSDIKYSAPEDFSGNTDSEIYFRKDKDDVSFWKEIFAKSTADHIVKILCDSPFIDIKIISEMIDVHTKYLAEFTYSENLPQGFSCEIISKELINAIPEQAEKTLPLAQVIRSNINKFDVELFYKAPDIRNKRLAFRSGNPREIRIMENIVDIAGRIPRYSEVKEIIDKNPGVLYLCPSYLEIELTGSCMLDCLFCYRNTLQRKRPDMGIDLFKKILKDMETFKLPYSVCFGGSGEPLMHKNFYEFLELARNDKVQNIVIETNGILADTNFKNYIVNNNDERIRIVFNINGLDSETYSAIHNKDYFDIVFKNIISIKENITTDNNIYIQIMKINETEAFLDRFYDFWEKYKIPIILQKQNTYLGKIQDRNYSDLTPLERTPCWHLQRDLNVLSDGTVTFCKQDVNGDYARGNLNNESIEELFTGSKDKFLNDYRQSYETSPDCQSCNEWYTFNL